MISKEQQTINLDNLLYKTFIGFDDEKFNLYLKRLDDSLVRLNFNKSQREIILKHVFTSLIYNHQTKLNIGEIDLLIDQAIKDCPSIDESQKKLINQTRYSLKSNDWLTGDLYNMTANEKTYSPVATALRLDNFYPAMHATISYATSSFTSDLIKKTTGNVRADFVNRRKQAEELKREFNDNTTEENNNHNYQLVYQEIEKIVLAIKLTHSNLDYDTIIDQILPEVDNRFILACIDLTKENVNRLKRKLIDKISFTGLSIEIDKKKVKENLKIVESLSVNTIIESQTAESSMIGGVLDAGITIGCNMARYTNSADAIANFLEYTPKKTNKKIIAHIENKYKEAEDAKKQSENKKSTQHSPRSTSSPSEINNHQQDLTNQNLFKEFIGFDDAKYNLYLKSLNDLLIDLDYDPTKRKEILKHVFSSLIYNNKIRSNIGELDLLIETAIKECSSIDDNQKKLIIEQRQLYKFSDPMQNTKQLLASKKSQIASILQFFRLENAYPVLQNTVSYSLDSIMDLIIKEAVTEVRDDFIFKRTQAEKIQEDFENYSEKKAKQQKSKEPFHQDHQLVYQEIEKIVLAIKLTHDNLDYEKIIDQVLSRVDYEFISACIGLSSENINKLKRKLIDQINVEDSSVTFDKKQIKQNLKIVESLSLKELIETQTSSSSLLGSGIQAGLIFGCAIGRITDSLKSSINHLELASTNNHPKIISSIKEKYNELRFFSISYQSSSSSLVDQPSNISHKKSIGEEIPVNSKISIASTFSLIEEQKRQFPPRIDVTNEPRRFSDKKDSTKIQPEYTLFEKPSYKTNPCPPPGPIEVESGLAPQNNSSLANYHLTRKKNHLAMKLHIH